MIKDLALILAIVLLLFGAVNAAAWYFLQSGTDPSGRGWLLINPESVEGTALREKVFSTTDAKLLRQLESEPVLRPHTVLQFTNGFSTDAYTIGVQGIRYETGWTDAEVETLLRSGSAVFVFGGSTVFGQGVGDNDTVVAQLNRLDSSRRYINFGVNSYDSQRELDKLVYLLRQGYRPGQVLFIDGLNDLTTFISTPYRVHDKPRSQGFLIDRGKPSLIMGAPVPRNMLLAFAYALPVTHLYHRLTVPLPAVPYSSLDANRDRLDYSMLAYYYQNQFEYAEQNLEDMIADWLAYYPQHVEFAQRLGQSFGFKSHAVFQPFGGLDPDNPFLRPRYFGSRVEKTAVAFTAAATAAIANGSLPIHDCQEALASVDSAMAWVDATHYSPSGNLALAQCVLAAMQLTPE